MTPYSHTPPMNPRHVLRRRDGVALVLVLFIVMAIGALVMAAVVVSSNATLISLQEERRDNMETFADAGLEVVRARLNADRTLYSDTNFTTVEDRVTLVNGAGQTMTGWQRSTYAGPYGQSTGEYGIHGALISVVESPSGTRVVRRLDVTQESFAKYAWFTNIEGMIYFGAGDQINGPVHSNDVIRVHSSGATFLGKVTTASTVSGAANGDFRQGYAQGVSRIEMPAVADLSRLRTHATAGRTAFTTPSGSGSDNAKLRIEFVTIDLNGDGDGTDDNEGFFRVYATQSDVHLSMGRHDASSNFYDQPMLNADICGYYDAGLNRFVTSQDPSLTGLTSSQKMDATVRRADSRCYLAGDPRLFPNQQIPASGEWRPTRPAGLGPVQGNWVARGWALSGSVPAALSGRSDYAFLFPLSKTFNPDFKGVIHVAGPVAVSGDVRGRVTLAASGNIYLVDDLRYARGPSSQGCADILGLFSGGNITESNNLLSTPVIPRMPSNSPAYNTVFTYDESATEYIHAFVLTLGSFGAEQYGDGPTSGQSCGVKTAGRGCLELAGGVIQGTRGAVGDVNGHGYVKRYSYDVCGATHPPPYFPTTGHFTRSTYYELDPRSWTSADDYYGRWLSN